MIACWLSVQRLLANQYSTIATGSGPFQPALKSISGIRMSMPMKKRFITIAERESQLNCSKLRKIDSPMFNVVNETASTRIGSTKWATAELVVPSSESSAGSIVR